VVRDGGILTTLTPLDRNYNPADAKINETRVQVVAGYSRSLGSGFWQTTASFAHSDITDIRGFLRPSLANDGSPNADSQRQSRSILDVYLDTHASAEIAPQLIVVYGADLLYGVAKQSSANGEYFAALEGSDVPPTTNSLHVDEINTIHDRRTFAGQYVQMDWKPDNKWNLNGGMRLSETQESLRSSHVDGFDSTADLSANSSQGVRRLVGAIGASYRAWSSGNGEELVPFVSFRNTFKPAAQDFGPDYRPDVLKPEAARSYELGLKGAMLGGRLGFTLDAFLLDFKNLVVTTTDASGNPLVQNAGAERLKGAEAEARAIAAQDLTLSAALSYHDARFRQYIATEGGANVDARGKQLPMSPRVLASLGVVYSPATGLNASVVSNYVGSRYLDISNAAPTPHYLTGDLTLGYRWKASGLKLLVNNLSNRRPPISASEFGDQSFYLLPGRTVLATFAMDL
jgi:iron complex outermembrane receptor protein